MLNSRLVLNDIPPNTNISDVHALALVEIAEALTKMVELLHKAQEENKRAGTRKEKESW